MWDPSNVCDLHHRSWQCRILNPLNKAGIEPATSWFLVDSLNTEPRQELLGKLSKSLDKCFPNILLLFKNLEKKKGYLWRKLVYIVAFCGGRGHVEVPRPGIKPHRSCDHSRSSDYAGSLPCYAMRELTIL